MSGKSDAPVVWKHIGLNGHSVGTFICEGGRIVWKSAITGRDEDVGTTTSRSLPSGQLASAQWTVFGRSGHLRVQTKKESGLKHELRFDGFPVADFDMLKATLRKNFNLDLQVHNLSAAGTQYGLTTIKGKNLLFKHCVLEDVTEDGQEFEPRPEDEMMSLDLAEISQCVLPGNNRNEIEVQFPESDAVEANADQLGKITVFVVYPEDLYISLSVFIQSFNQSPAHSPTHSFDALSFFVPFSSFHSFLHSPRTRRRSRRQGSRHSGRAPPTKHYADCQYSQDNRRCHCQL
jgi:hypothetical protein